MGSRRAAAVSVHKRHERWRFIPASSTAADQYSSPCRTTTESRHARYVPRRVENDVCLWTQARFLGMDRLQGAVPPGHQRCRRFAQATRKRSKASLARNLSQFSATGSPISKTVSTATDTSPGMLLQPSRRGELVPETLPHCSEPHNKGQQDGWPKVNKGVIMASDSERAESFA
jgi:hypothetical protein